MATVYVKRGSLFCGGVEYSQGSVLKEPVLRSLNEAGQLDELVKSGILGNLDDDSRAFLKTVAGVKTPPPVAPPGDPEKPKSITPISPWILDPKTLEGKTLDQLNVMIKEIDPSEDLFEDAKEAISFLSQDFQK